MCVHIFMISLLPSFAWSWHCCCGYREDSKRFDRDQQGHELSVRLLDKTLAEIGETFGFGETP